MQGEMGSISQQGQENGRARAWQPQMSPSKYPQSSWELVQCDPLDFASIFLLIKP